MQARNESSAPQPVGTPQESMKGRSPFISNPQDRLKAASAINLRP